MARFQCRRMFSFSQKLSQFSKVDIEVTLPFSGCIVVPHNNELFFVYILTSCMFSCEVPICVFSPFKNLLFIYFGCAGLSLLCAGLLQLRQPVAVLVFSLVGGISCCGAWALGCAGFSGWRLWALEWRLSSCGSCAWLPCACAVFCTRDRTHVLCIGRWILNHGPPGRSFSPFLAGQLMVFLIDLYEFFVYSGHESFVRYMRCEYFLSMACLFISGVK